MKKRSFLIVCIFLLIILFFTSNVFASYDVVQDDKTFTFPDYAESRYWVLVEYSGYYRLIVGDTPYFVLYQNSSYSPHTTYICNVTAEEYVNSSDFMKRRGTLRTYAITVDTTVFTDKYNDDNGMYVGSTSSVDDVIILACSTNSKVYYEGNVFFQVTPPTTLAEIMEVEKTEKRTMQEIVGLLPLILVVVVSFLGLRKALRMLVNFLRRS